MAFTVNLYTLAKKKNSTEVPASVAVSFTNCIIKDGCGIVNPSIGIENGLAWNPSSYNYAGIPAYNRFYYITDWYFDRGRWWANMAVDVLATYKTTILSNTAYVARAAKSYDGTIIDGLYPASSEKRAVSHYMINPAGGSLFTPWTPYYSSGFFVVGIINNDNNAAGATSYYMFSLNQFQALKAFLLSSSEWTGIEVTNPDFGDNLYKSLFDPFQYIVTINWFPFTLPSTLGTLQTGLKFGWWTLSTISCYRLDTFKWDRLYTLPFGTHPQAEARGAYLNGAPYTTYQLIAPPWGEFNLDPAILCNVRILDQMTSPALSINIQVDLISGYGDLFVGAPLKNGGNATVLYNTSLLAVPIQMAQINNNAWGQIRNIVSTGANVIGSAAHLDVGGTIANLANGILDGIELNVPHVQQTGSNGSMAQYAINFILTDIYTIVVPDALADKGRPLCQEVSLGTLYPGYVQTVGAHVEIAGTETEIGQINNYLDGGVYLE